MKAKHTLIILFYFLLLQPLMISLVSGILFSLSCYGTVSGLWLKNIVLLQYLIVLPAIAMKSIIALIVLRIPFALHRRLKKSGQDELEIHKELQSFTHLWKWVLAACLLLDMVLLFYIPDLHSLANKQLQVSLWMKLVGLACSGALGLWVLSVFYAPIFKQKN